jgi:hypothetical protein
VLALTPQASRPSITLMLQWTKGRAGIDKQRGDSCMLFGTDDANSCGPQGIKAHQGKCWIA